MGVGALGPLIAAVHMGAFRRTRSSPDSKWAVRCRYCGEEGFQWRWYGYRKDEHPNGWRMHKNGVVHSCKEYQQCRSRTAQNASIRHYCAKESSRLL